jgi:CheY-like chemotaxis protein
LHFDLIVLDIGMTGMDGYVLLEALRAMPHPQSTPTIVLSGYGGEANDQSSGTLGFQLLLQKLIPTEQLGRSVGKSFVRAAAKISLSYLSTRVLALRLSRVV